MKARRAARHRTAHQEAALGHATAIPQRLIDRARKWVSESLSGLPETTLRAVGLHGGLEVRGKRFGWLLVDHHGDGRLAINLRCTAILAGALKDALPAHFHVPAYVGHRGWIGLWLDVPGLDRRLLDNAVTEAWWSAAPKRLRDAMPPRR